MAMCLSLLTTILFINGCDNDNEPNQSPTPENILVGKTLTLISVKVDGVDKTNLYSGLILQFDDKSYESTEGDPFFNPIGTWQSLSTINTIEFDGSLQSEFKVVSEDVVRFTFEWDETIFGGGRLSSIEGTHEIEMRIR